MNDLTAVILTKNEEINIERCIHSLKGLADRIVVVDSGSTDKTVEMAESLGAEIYEHTPFIHYAAQFNWALDHVDIKTKWVYRIDADEVVPPELKEEIISQCRMHSNDDVSAFCMRHKIFFMGRFLTHGGIYPMLKITIFKFGKGRFENRAMGEHIVVMQGKTIELKNDCLHYDYKDLNSWLDKHNWYATREVSDYFATLNNQQANVELYGQPQFAKKLRDKIYYNLPKFFRARIYFWYRYYFKMAFLDGRAGRIHAYLQAYWYRYIVDAKIVEQEIKMNQKRKKY